MQQLDSFYETAIRRGHHIEGAPIVVAEWNFNNIFEPTVTNTPDDQDWAYGKKYFPAKAVGNSIRPKASGIFAAFTNDAWTTDEFTLGVSGQRYYTTGSDPDKVFNYWICPTPSNLNKVGLPSTGEDDPLLPESYGVNRGTLLLEYPGYVNVNKVKVLFNLGPSPSDWSIFLHTQGAPGDGYIEIQNPTVDPITGLAQIWWDGADWIETQELDEAVFSQIDKIKVEVRAIDEPGKYLQIVEISGGREIDLTHRVLDYSINFQMDDVDFITPVGKIVSADGSITFNNTDLKINEQDEFSDFYGLLSGRCEYRTYVKYKLQDYGGGDVIMRTGTLYSNDWQQINEYEYQVELWDVLKLLQITKIPARLYEGIPIARIVSQILDSVGIDSYDIDPEDFDASSIVKYFWASGDETVFDILNGLCKSYQAAIYVDEFGVIQLLTRAQIANETDDPVWTFRGEQVGDDIADIAILQKKYNLQANDVTIKYNQMEAAIDNTDITAQITEQPTTSKLWEAQDTVLLRASAVIRDMSADGLDHVDSVKDIYINADNVVTWPYQGKVNVDGELIEYDGKEYYHWDFSDNPPTKTATVVKSDEEKRALDKATYLSYDPDNPGIPGSSASDLTKQNKFTGRMIVSKRDADETGRQGAHYNYWNYGWMGMRAWTFAAGNPSFPGRYVDPGGSVYNPGDVQDYINRVNWNSLQTRWSITDSVVKCNNTADGDINSSVLVRDVGNTECREIGTRVRLTGDASGGIIFCMTDATGYDLENPTLTDPVFATRWYQLTIATTTAVEKVNRTVNEIALEVKNGNSMTRMTSTRGIGWGGPAVGSDGIWQIDEGVWYDIDLVIKDAGPHGEDPTGATATQVEVYIDGRWVDTWTTNDNIKPTGWMGVHARQKCIVEYDYFYATSAVSNNNPGYTNDENFDVNIFNFESGTNVKKTLNLAQSYADRGGFQSVLSFSTGSSDATISSLKVKGGAGSAWAASPYTSIKQLGPIVVKPNTRVIIDIDSAAQNASAVDLTYTSTEELSVCWEYTTQRNFPYNIDTWVTPTDTSFYDIAKNGYLSNKHNYFAIDNTIYPAYTESSIIVDNRGLFTDDFGAMAHEVRDFEVDFDVKPAKGVRVYLSNNKIRVVGQTYNPEKGIFTLANASNRDEIVNGTEEIDDQNSIDHILMLYGYILEDKGEKTKVVKNESSIRRYGPISIDVDATWVFNEAEAEALGNWITEHWADPMDTITLEVFSNTFTQIGDKVNIVYDNANIEEDWLYIVSERSTNFDNDGLSSTVTLRRVR
jgi:hypothetical protein